MRNEVRLSGVLVLLLIAASSCSQADETWRERLADELPLLGHRNWIVIADSAYPAQIGEGIETIATGEGQLDAVRAVLDAVDRAPHVRALVRLDGELEYVPDADAPGIGEYRSALEEMLEGRQVDRIPHEELIGLLDEAAGTFRVLILKTEMTLPYTSVFLLLDCGYWGEDAESRLRQRIPPPEE